MPRGPFGSTVFGMKSRLHRLILVFTIVAAAGLLLKIIPETTYDNGRFDSVLDGALAVTMFIVALVFFLSQRLAGDANLSVCWAFTACGLIRFYGSAVDSENGIVWLHRLCSICLVVVVIESEHFGQVGGLPRRWSRAIYLSLVGVATLVAVRPGALPLAVGAHHALAPIVAYLCTFTAAAYGVATLRAYVNRPGRSYALDRMVTCCLALGIPPLYYGSYPVWSAQWWCFQFFELGATSYLAVSLLNTHLAQIMRLRTELLEKTRHMERTLALVSHDIRNPLGVGSTGLTLLEHEFTGADHSSLVLDKLRSNVEYMNDIIQTLIESTATISGRPTELEYADGDLSEFIRHALGAHEEDEARRVQFVAEPDDFRGRWPRTALRRVLTNLVSNAFKYGRPDADVTVSLRTFGNAVRLSVHNEGAPIAEGERQRIFQPYHRARATEKDRTPGWGLGLSLVKNVADAAGGRVWVESQRAHGTTFNFELPKGPNDGTL